MARCSLGLMAVVVAILAGCNEPAATSLNYAVREIPGTSVGPAFSAAAEAMREHFRIARMDRAEGVIVSQPAETQEPGQAGRVGDVLGAERRMRRVAEVRVTESGGSAQVFCKVVVQQFESEERRLFTRDHAVSDIPSETPAERDSATTAEQNATWRNRGRDKVLERQILDAILERLGAGAAAPAD